MGRCRGLAGRGRGVHAERPPPDREGEGSRRPSSSSVPRATSRPGSVRSPHSRPGRAGRPTRAIASSSRSRSGTHRSSWRPTARTSATSRSAPTGGSTCSATSPQSIARVGDAGRRRSRRAGRRGLGAAEARWQARGPGADPQRPGDRGTRHEEGEGEPRAPRTADRGGSGVVTTADGRGRRARRRASLHRSDPGARTRSARRPDAEGTNFALFSQHATTRRAAPLRAPRLAEAGQDHRRSTRASTGRSTSGTSTSTGVTPGMGYAYRVDGPQDLHGAGHRFNPNKVLIDPYGRGTTSTLWDRVAACGPDDNVAQLAAQRRHRHDRLRLGGRPAAQPADAGDGHLRDARPRLHQVADLGRRRTPARTSASSRRSRTSSRWASPRSSCCPSSSSTRTRSAARTR